MRAAAVVLALVLAGSAGAPATAAEDGFHPEPWRPYRAQDFVAPAGSYCEFALSVEAVHDEEEVRVNARYPDGTVRVNEYRGTLITKFTNLASGDSVQRDLSGRGWQELYPDGETTKTFGGVGPFGAGFRSQDEYPQGYYRLDGVHFIGYAQDGTRRMLVSLGTQENLCDTLS